MVLPIGRFSLPSKPSEHVMLIFNRFLVLGDISYVFGSLYLKRSIALGFKIFCCSSFNDFRFLATFAALRRLAAAIEPLKGDDEKSCIGSLSNSVASAIYNISH
jgi:hypothetical protein